MPKDPTRNIDRYKIRGGQMNAFEFHQNQGDVSEQRQEHGNWTGAPEEGADLPPDKAKAERIRQLLAKHGEPMPQADGNSTEIRPNENSEENAEMENLQTGDQHKANSDKTKQEKIASESVIKAKDGSRTEDAETGEEDFAPTHGRSSEVIKEMIQSRRATNRVPDPRDIVAARADQSEEKKERGETGRRTSPRQPNKQTSRSQQTVRSQYQKAAKGKEAALDKSKPKVAKATSAKKEGKPPTARKNAKLVAASTSKRQSGKQTATSRSVKKASTSSSGKQTAARKNQAGASVRNDTGTRSASSRQKANSKTASSTKTRRTTPPKRAKSNAGKSR